MQNAGHDARAYFNVPGGFAVVTRVERLDGETGRHLTGNARWDDRRALAGISLSALWSALFITSRPTGHYRALLFIFTNHPPEPQPVAETRLRDVMDRWALSGRPSLPPELRNQPIGTDHELVMYIYEFEKEQGRPVRHNLPSRWPMSHHLQDLGISFKPRS